MCSSDLLENISPDNSQKEYYLPDTIEYLVQSGYPIQAIQINDANEILGINSRDDLGRAVRLLEEHYGPS